MPITIWYVKRLQRVLTKLWWWWGCPHQMNFSTMC